MGLLFLSTLPRWSGFLRCMIAHHRSSITIYSSCSDSIVETVCSVLDSGIALSAAIIQTTYTRLNPEGSF